MLLCANRNQLANAIVLASLLLLLNGKALGEPENLMEETWNSGWSFHLDNDFLALLNEDQQYTGGASVELSGRRAREWDFSADPLLAWIDRLTGMERRMASGDDDMRHSMILGLAAFTPEDIESPQPILDDHPYGSLVLFGNTRQSVDPSRNVAYRSSLVLGLLGTNLAESLQDFFHDLVDTQKAQGWDNQISDGGELTGRYEVSRHQLIQSTPLSENRRLESRWKINASAGYVTQVGVGATARWGKFDEQWFRFDPAPGEYVAYGAPATKPQSPSANREWFFWTSLEASLRLYNALLQGQFRDSAVTFSRGELRELITEASVGVTAELFSTGLRGEFSISYRTSEIKESLADDALWGANFTDP
ncbi:MAG: lipid A deacylase LpxR family protein [Spiribacter salinus]|uniref:Lipid A deacylase LpxR family protein n=1 Tax=Spiribacter salinus TaxID=1335746 RepID=A0A540VRQ6_9GAMM|nr:MAG: lipid A deacylase LpxR family protein [Spiribacter salinus]